MKDITDLEITKLCAEAMGYRIEAAPLGPWKLVCWAEGGLSVLGTGYDPLHDDAQAMALVKRFEPQMDKNNAFGWTVEKSNGFRAPPFAGYSSDLNRAICECCARMMLAKNSQSTENEKEKA